MLLGEYFGFIESQLMSCVFQKAFLHQIVSKFKKKQSEPAGVYGLRSTYQGC